MLIPAMGIKLTNFSGTKKIGIKQMTIVTAFLIFTFILLTQNVFAQVPTVEITSSQPRMAAPPANTQLTVPAGQSFVRVTFDYVGIEGNDRLREFQCTWFGIGYASQTCPNIISGQDTYRMAGRVIKEACAGQYTFGVKVLNSGPNPDTSAPSRLSAAAERHFTVTHTPPTTTTLDPTRCPIVDVYKANSYAGSVPTSGQNQYHYEIVEPVPPTPYNKMYIVFAGLYPTGTITGYRSDLYDTSAGARTTFECRFDSVSGTESFVPCGRANIITSVSPGRHTIDIKARNAQGATGSEFLNRFIWCVRPQSVPTACDGEGHPTNIYRPITASNLNWFISEAAANDFFGKNETIPLNDLKEFSTNIKEFSDNYKKTGAKNGTLYLKETPFINESIGTKNTLQNKTTGINTTNVTSLGLNDTQTMKADNASIVKEK